MLGRPRMIRKGDPKIFRTCMKKKYNWSVFNNKINHLDEIGISTKEHCISGSIQYKQSRPSSFKGQHCYKNSQLIIPTGNSRSEGHIPILWDQPEWNRPCPKVVSVEVIVKEDGRLLSPANVNRQGASKEARKGHYDRCYAYAIRKFCSLPYQKSSFLHATLALKSPQIVLLFGLSILWQRTNHLSTNIRKKKFSRQPRGQ